MAKKPDLDAQTLRIMARMVRMPPKPHDEMKIGKRTAKKRASPKRRRSQNEKLA